MKASIQNLIQEIKAVVFEKDELEFRDTSDLKTLLQLLAYQDSSSERDIIFKVLRKEQSTSGIKLSRLSPRWKIRKQTELKKYKFEDRGVYSKSLSGKSCPSRFYRGVQIQGFLNQKLQLK